MWPEASASIVNLAKKLLQFEIYRIFPRGGLILARLFIHHEGVPCMTENYYQIIIIIYWK